MSTVQTTIILKDHSETKRVLTPENKNEKHIILSADKILTDFIYDLLTYQLGDYFNIKSIDDKFSMIYDIKKYYKTSISIFMKDQIRDINGKSINSNVYLFEYKNNSNGAIQYDCKIEEVECDICKKSIYKEFSDELFVYGDDDIYRLTVCSHCYNKYNEGAYTAEQINDIIRGIVK